MRKIVLPSQRANKEHNTGKFLTRLKSDLIFYNS